MDALHAASLEEHVGSLSGHSVKNLITCRTRYGLNSPLFLGTSLWLLESRVTTLQNLRISMPVTWTVCTLGCGFAFDIDAKRPTKKGKLVAMAPMDGVVHETFTVTEHGQELFTIIVVKQGDSFGAL